MPAAVNSKTTPPWLSWRVCSNTASKNKWYQDTISLSNYAGQRVRLQYENGAASTEVVPFRTPMPRHYCVALALWRTGYVKKCLLPSPQAIFFQLVQQFFDHGLQIARPAARLPR